LRTGSKMSISVSGSRRQDQPILAAAEINLEIRPIDGDQRKVWQTFSQYEQARVGKIHPSVAEPANFRMHSGQAVRKRCRLNEAGIEKLKKPERTLQGGAFQQMADFSDVRLGGQIGARSPCEYIPGPLVQFISTV